MFKHYANERTFEHNLKIATLLSFVAGSVNVVGFLSVLKLTTNVTGHFAFFVDDMFNLRFYDGFIAFLYIFTFFAGAFVSNTLVESIRKRSNKNIFAIPVTLEIAILMAIGVTGRYIYLQHPNIIATSLLFAMGLQNSLVTKISNAVVRTTHLTGLFTDLGIEVSQLFFYRTKEQQTQLKSTIRLRLRIIIFFFIGGVFAGYIYSLMHFYVLLIPALLLLTGMILDHVTFKTAHKEKK